MIRTLLIFIIVLASVWLGVVLQHDSGYILIAMNHWTIETTLWVAIPLLILLFVILHLLLSLSQKICHFPTAWRNWRVSRRTKKAQEKTRQGLIEFSEGHWLSARNHLIKALPDTDTPLFNYLTAARAAQELGDNKRRDDYLRQAQQSMPDAKIAVELTQAQLQLANKQWEQALATLKHLHDLAPKHPYVLKLLMDVYQQMQDWAQLIALLPMLKRYNVLSQQAYDKTQQNAYLNQLLNLVQQNNATSIEVFYSKLPKPLNKDAALMAIYCRYLLNQNEEIKAEAILRRCLQKQLDDALIDLYGQIKQNTSALQFAESCLKKQPHSAVLLLCAGRLCMAQHLWGKAKTYFEESLKLHETSATYAEYGHLLEQLHDHAGACNAYRKGLILIMIPT